MSAEIIVLKIPSIMETDRYNWLLEVVSEEKRTKVKRLRLLKDTHRTLLGEALVRAAIVSRLGLSNEHIRFVENEFGKPALCGFEKFQFNISHSGDWVAVFLSDVPIGIDVEEIRPIDTNIAESYMAPAEYEDIMDKNERERLSYFYDLWTLKESYIKAKGEGLSIPLHTFSISIRNDGSIVLDPATEPYYFKTYELEPRYKLAACSSDNRFPTALTHWNIDDLRVHLECDWTLGIM
ncbi:4'-phosphopantetheinyl transferase family protein [Paenibacillus sp. GCM10027627]|uniref:4'-phosphopantetheinyl transferase family protein n=1 Tax=unclassified Paenibacillus TaxID=185978 RepID=UPI0036430F14